MAADITGTGTARALVLGGGGVAGIAWMTGLLAGLAAVDCVSGELTVFDAGSGVSLVDAVTAIGTNALDPATRVPAATAGRAQGRAGLGQTLRPR